MRWVLLLLFLSGLAVGQGFRLGLAFEGQLLPLGVAAFAEYRTAAGGLARISLGYDYLGGFAVSELGWITAADPWKETRFTLGGGSYLFPVEGAPGAFALVGAGYYDYTKNLGAWAGVMLPETLPTPGGELTSGGGLALFALVRVRVEFATLEVR